MSINLEQLSSELQTIMCGNIPIQNKLGIYESILKGVSDYTKVVAKLHKEYKSVSEQLKVSVSENKRLVKDLDAANKHADEANKGILSLYAKQDALTAENERLKKQIAELKPAATDK